LGFENNFFFSFDNFFEDLNYYFHDYLSLYFKYVRSQIGFYEKIFFFLDENTNNSDIIPSVFDLNYYEMTGVKYKFDLNLDYKYKMKTLRLKKMDMDLSPFERFYYNKFFFDLSDIDYLSKFNKLLFNLIYNLKLDDFHVIDRYLWNARMAYAWNLLEDIEVYEDEIWGEYYWFQILPKFWPDLAFVPYLGRKKAGYYLSRSWLRIFLFDFKRYSLKLLMLNDAFRDFFFTLIRFFCLERIKENLMV